ncbi:hypothetical protein ETB97_008315 [Aspergillus alliaceus]|uniref:Uncharacterized protein n=1 Tax=Petromyces alliaceus TaxID=209559 RepID=A0A8H5ZT50_PETAA|nr:hypothetical protein ETB97_008315 [Aspergillus burnettii]
MARRYSPSPPLSQMVTGPLGSAKTSGQRLPLMFPQPYSQGGSHIASCTISSPENTVAVHATLATAAPRAQSSTDSYSSSGVGLLSEDTTSIFEFVDRADRISGPMEV